MLFLQFYKKYYALLQYTEIHIKYIEQTKDFK